MSDFIFTIGADPEIFLKDSKGKGVSAHGRVPGTKQEPYQVDNGAIQVDGMALEFNINPTTLDFGSFNNFNQNIISVMKTLKEKVVQATPKGFRTPTFQIVPTMDFDPDYLKTLPEEVLELGCNPDMNAYTLQENPRPEADNVNFRTAAGHIHIGWGSDIPVDNQEHIEICADFVKMLDATVGLYMTIIDSDSRRRQLYGKAGAMRPKPYGVEYRTPSNVWLVSKERRRIVFLLCELAVTLMKIGRSLDSWFDGDIQTIINNGDFHSAYYTLISKRTLGNYSSDYRLESLITLAYENRRKVDASS